MITVKTGHTVYLTNIILDGNGGKVPGTDGGGISQVKGGRLILDSGAILQNSVCNVNNSGAIYVTNNKNKDPGTFIMNDGSMIRNCGKNDRDGGAVYIYDGYFEMHGGTITDCTAKNGSAVYVPSGKTFILSGGSIISNTAKDNAPGVYLASGAKMSISGNPVFSNNIVIKDGYAGLKNGGELVYTDNKVRQDIYICERNENKPSSMSITGDLTGSPGSIWIWAEDDVHYRQGMPFGKFNLPNGVKFVSEGADGETKLDASHLKVFRNAQDDVTTGNSTGVYLFGTINDELKGYVCWTKADGLRLVVLRKVDGDNNQLEGAVFEFHRSVDGPSFMECTSISNGLFYVGELAYGTYYLKETVAPRNFANGKWFALIVDDKGAWMSSKGYNSSSDALTDASNVRNGELSN